MVFAMDKASEFYLLQKTVKDYKTKERRAANEQPHFAHYDALRHSSLFSKLQFDNLSRRYSLYFFYILISAITMESVEISLFPQGLFPDLLAHRLWGGTQKKLLCFFFFC